MKYSRALAKKILMAGVILGVMITITNRVQTKITDYELARPDYGGTSTEYQLEADDGQEQMDISVVIPPKTYSDAQLQQHFDAVESQLVEIIKGENVSLDQVNQPLKLVSCVAGEGITIQWYSSDYSLVDFNGTVYNHGMKTEEHKSCTLRAELIYGETVRDMTYEITVVAPTRTEKEEYRIQVEEALAEAALNQQGESVHLPENIAGKKMTYSRKEDGISAMTFPLLAVLAVGTLYVGTRAEEKKKLQQRCRQLQYDYAEVILKLTLLVGAGMAFRKAWEKIVMDYKKNTKAVHVRCVYEEMENTLNEMRTGISEMEAYARFGKRCDTREYLKLSSLLQQNLKKGSKGLAIMLQEEAQDAFELRKNLAVQRGEEAGTKLLIPMVMMLVVVMMIIMVPAMMAFQV